MGCTRRDLLTLWWFTWPLMSALSAPDIIDYGRRCAEEIGVEIPKINCLSAAGTLLPVTHGGVVMDRVVESCDKPALLSSEKACVPGNRLFRFNQKSSRGEAVSTMVLCRRVRSAVVNATAEELLNDARFHDIGVIQYNEVSHKACWYFMEDHSGKIATAIPRPFSSEWNGSREGEEAIRTLQFWQTPQVTSAGRCIKCHDSGAWIRTPFVAQANGTANEIPGNSREPIRHVELEGLFRDWNGELGPHRIKVKETSFVEGLSAAERESYRKAVDSGDAAPAQECTRCHGLGKARDARFHGLGTCGQVLEAALGGGSERLFSEPAVPWMPPQHGLAGPAWQSYFRFAIAAARGCCGSPEKCSVGGE